MRYRGRMVVLLLACASTSAPPPPAAIGAPSAPAASADAAPRPPLTTPTTPNVVILDVDSLRDDAVEPHGAPALARLAAEGVRFTTTRAAAGWTLPGFLSLLAGRPAEADLLGERIPEPLRDRLLPALMTTYGYHVAYTWGDTLLASHPDAGAWFGAEARSFPTLTDAGAHLGELSEPFFFLAHDVDLHPLDRRVELSGAARLELPSEAVRAEYRSEYASNVARADAAVGAFLTALDAAGHHDDTLVVLTSDHGESFGDHGWMGHGVNLHEDVLRVPLVIRGPGVPAGRNITTAVGTIDVAPTLLAASGIPVYAKMTGQALQPLWTGGALSERTFYAQSNAVAAARVEGDLKLLVLPPECGDDTPAGTLRKPACTWLFDLAADPGETTNLAAARPDDARRLRDDLFGWLGAQSDPESLRQSQEFKKALRKHGYFDAEPGK